MKTDYPLNIRPNFPPEGIDGKQVWNVRKQPEIALGVIHAQRISENILYMKIETESPNGCKITTVVEQYLYDTLRKDSDKLPLQIG
jgi:hypothetical protein